MIYIFIVPIFYRKHKIKAFSLIEVMVCLSIILLGMGVCMQQQGIFKRMIIRQEMNRLFHEIYAVRSVAMIQGEPREIRFDRIAHRYESGGIWHDLPAVIKFGVLPGIQGPPSRPQSAIVDPIHFVGHRITCYPDGTIQAGTIYVIDDDALYQYAITSGASSVSLLRKYRYDGSWQLDEK